MIECLAVGALETNCYIVADDATKEAALIDPAGDEGRIRKILKENSLKLKFILNTHGHGDHIGANGSFKVPIYIHRLDADFLRDPKKNLSSFFMFGIRSPEAERLLEHGDKISLGNLEFEVIHTPGHTPGSVSFKLGDVIFTGDALFAGGIGRTDFPYGDEELLLRSIRDRLLVYSDDTVIYPGHGESSTIGRERRENPFLCG
jgi:glyoxylase-like metal-dependent hydrolase (beta-lactamase superfamily II)